MELLSLLLSPLSAAMRFLLDAYRAAIGSYGPAIILLSATVRLLTFPINRMATAAEARDRGVRDAMEKDLREIRRTSKGRERFERIDALYQRHKYHPIQSMVSLLPLFLLLPFLLAALFLLSGYAPLAGERFLFIPDLLRPDGLIRAGGFKINLIPLLITALAFGESLVKVDSTRGSRIRFLIIGLVIVVLIYDMPAGVCLYWATSNLLSFLSSALRRLKAT